MYGIMLKIFTIAAVFLSLTAAMPNVRPPYIDCVNSNECGKNECCSIGMGRFSIPQCRPRRESGESCSPWSLPRSGNVTYPDGAEVVLKNIYDNICPCSDGLICHKDTGVCSDPTIHEFFNDLDYY